MNSEKDSLNSSDEKSVKHIILNMKFIIVCLVFVLLIGVLFYAKWHSEKKQTGENKQLETVTPMLEDEKELNEKEKEDIHEYNSYVESFNQTIKDYNSKIEKYNNLLSELKNFEFLDFPEPFLTKAYLEEVEKPVVWDKTQLDEQKIEMEKVMDNIDGYSEQLIINTYNCVIDEYNLVAKEYNEAVKISSVDYITELPKEVILKNRIENITEELNKENKALRTYIEERIKETEELSFYLAIVQQITNPSSEWIIKCLEKTEGILETQSVSVEKDPNQLLGKQGGYTSCTYFSYKEISQDTVNGNDVIEKGTKCGGAIEVYANKEDALNRCEYLSQFDETLLYSGSYIIIGTMVVRTSYKLTNQQQVELTNNIIQSLTEFDMDKQQEDKIES